MIEYDLFHRLYRRHGQKWGATRCPNQRSASQSVNITPHSSQSVHPRSPSAVLVFRTAQNWMNESVSKTTVTAQRRGCSYIITMNMDFICEAWSPRSTHTHSYTPRCIHTSLLSPSYLLMGLKKRLFVLLECQMNSLSSEQLSFIKFRGKINLVVLLKLLTDDEILVLFY